MESINALLIRQGLKQNERLIQLNQAAITQMKSLLQNNVLKKLEFRQNLPLLLIFNSIIILFALLKNHPLIIAFVSLFFMIQFINFVLFDKGNLKDIMAQLFSLVYISIPFSMMFFMEKTEYIWLVYISAWGTDTLAYVFGSLFGKHKLIPKVSPKKTVEGAVGGMIGAGIISLVYAIASGSTTVPLFVIIAIVGSAVGQVGDLCASKLKRLSDKKDYGSIFWGHGGVLDRFDSILFTIPYIYILYLLI